MNRLDQPNGRVLIHHATKRFGRKTVLASVHLELEPGSLLGIVGPSGVGKTTLLRIVAGLERPEDGATVEVAGRCAFVFQEPRLLPWRTARDNVALAVAETGRDGRAAQQAAMEWLEKTQVAEAANLYPMALSGGMAQRVSLARALAVEPDVLMLDEPFSALDAARRERMRDLVARTMEERPGMTVLYVTHQPSDIGELARTILRIAADGRWQLEDANARVLERHPG